MIYVVEDDAGIRDMMLYTLKSTGFIALGLADGAAFWEAMRIETPQLILLDIMMPGEDGISILKKLRSNPATDRIPIIMTTAKGAEYDKILGLDTGADDYLVKPFGMMELVSRIRAVLRRSDPPAAPSKYTVGELTLNDSEHTVTVNGERVALTLKEFELLHTFMANLGRVFTRDKLLENIWGTDYAFETRTVDVHVRTLRSKIGDCGRYIKTVRGVGYRMEADLE